MSRLAPIACLCLIACTLPAPAEDAPAHFLGREHRHELTTSVPDLQVLPVTEHAPLILRIASVEAGADGAYRYDLRYIGLEPGSLDLREFLLLADGSPAAPVLDPMPVTVTGILPPDFDGALRAANRQVPAWLPGYRVLLGVVVIGWVLALVPLWRWTHGKRERVVTAPPPPPPSLADRLRPLLEAAAARSLDTDGQARLERLLIAWWTREHGLQEHDVAHVLRELRTHPDTGKLFRTLERWLHAPSPVTPAEMDDLLQPFESIRDPEAS